MRLHSTLQLLVQLLSLFAVRVQSVLATELCPRREPPPGVLALTLGSEVILHCRGDVTVNGEPLAMPLKHNERLRKREATTGVWMSQLDRENTGTTGTYRSTVRNIDRTGTYQSSYKSATGIHAEDQREAVTTTKVPTITTKKQTRDFFTVNQSSWTNGAGSEAFSVTMQTGISSERDMSMEYEDYEDYEDKEGGLRVTRGLKREMRWTRNGQRVRSIKRGWALRLPALQLTDSGNYSCYREDQLISSVKISVGVPPEIPTLSCRKKFHTSKVRCEWISRQPIIPPPHCYLLMKKGFEKYSYKPCSYSAERSRCWCALPNEEGDKNTYDARLCVTNAVGATVSHSLKFNLHSIIRPDPPAKVVVKAVKGHLHTLHIYWSYPTTWKYGFYFLKFQLRYRPLLAKEYQLVHIDGDTKEFSWRILDALPHTQYEVQLCAKDDYDGVWSEWTSSVYAYTWAAPEPTIVSDYTSLEPEGSGSEDDPKVEISGHPGNDADATWVYVLSVFGLSLFITLTMLLVYFLRNPRRFMSKMNKESCSPPFSRSSPSPPPFQQPLMAPRQQSQHHFLPVREEEGGGINLHNFDYFLSSSGD